MYECNDNFKLDGVSRRICSEDGTWGHHESPSCVEITCPSFNVSENLIVNTGKRLVGEMAKFSCPKGRYLVGNDTRTCLQNGKWAGKNPTCKRKIELNLYFNIDRLHHLKLKFLKLLTVKDQMKWKMVDS